MGLSIQEAIKKHDITIADLKEVTGVNVVSLYNYINGDVTPKESTYKKLLLWEPELEMKYTPSKPYALPLDLQAILDSYDRDEWLWTYTLPGVIFHHNMGLEPFSSTGIPVDHFYAYLKGERMFTKSEKLKLYNKNIDYFPHIIYDEESGKYLAKEENIKMTKKDIRRSRLIERISMSGGRLYGIENRDIGWLSAKLHKMGFSYRKWTHNKYGLWVIEYRLSVKWSLKMKPEPIVEEQEWVFKEVDEPQIKLVENAHSKIIGQMGLPI